MMRLELPVRTGRPLLRGILELSSADLLHWLRDRAHIPLRARQIHRWIVARRATSFEQMTDLPLSLRDELAAAFQPLGTTLVRRLTASDGTEKLLLRLADGNLVESVLMREADRRTVCISTQVGCGMGCVFCASGIGGVVRNLSTAEILEQLVHARNLLPPDDRLSHVVVMGMGEPLANLENLLAALNSACASEGLGLSARHIHISTVGLPTKVRRLADLDKRYHLAVSLHAPNDVLRNQIVPTNEKVGLTELLDAADYYFARTGRQVTYEYILLRNVNDRRDHATELARLLRGRKAHVNLIPFNDVVGLPFASPTRESVADFQAILRNGAISATIRKRKGADIDAACGQLRRAALQDVMTPELIPAGGV